MIVLSTNLEGYHIEISNSMLTGVEKVKINGTAVSSKFSWFGGTHHFTLRDAATGGQDNWRIRIGFTAWGSIGADIFRNNALLFSSRGKHVPPPTTAAPLERLDLHDLPKQQVPKYSTQDLV